LSPIIYFAWVLINLPLLYVVYYNHYTCLNGELTITTDVCVANYKLLAILKKQLNGLGPPAIEWQWKPGFVHLGMS